MKTELKPQDLRIGNLLQRSELDDDILTVTSINKESIGYSTNYGDGTMPIDWPIPIPLTQDMLLRFGFEKENYHLFRKGRYTYSIHDLAFRVWAENTIIFLNSFDTVHELQNVWYSLEKTELTLKP